MHINVIIITLINEKNDLRNVFKPGVNPPATLNIPHKIIITTISINLIVYRSTTILFCLSISTNIQPKIANTNKIFTGIPIIDPDGSTKENSNT